MAYTSPLFTSRGAVYWQKAHLNTGPLNLLFTRRQQGHPTVVYASDGKDVSLPIVRAAWRSLSRNAPWRNEKSCLTVLLLILRRGSSLLSGRLAMRWVSKMGTTTVSALLNKSATTRT